MVKSKKKSLPEWFWPAIIVGIVLLFFILTQLDLSNIELNTKSEEHIYRDEVVYEENIVNDVRTTNTETYCFNGECYTTREEYNQAQENYNYEEADNVWSQHSEILKNDAEKAEETYDANCVGIDMSGVPNCVNVVYPRLESYAIHITNAQNFLNNEGDVFDNQQELMAWTDEHSVYVKSLANNLDSIVNQYNSWVVQQQNQQAQAQQEAEILSNIIKILAMGI